MTAGGLGGLPCFQVGTHSERGPGYMQASSPWLLTAVDAEQADRVAVSDSEQCRFADEPPLPRSDADGEIEGATETCARLAPPPRPQSLEIDVGQDSLSSVRWFVDAGKLKQKQVATIVSPPFELPIGQERIQFKLIARARRPGADFRQHVSFRDAQGSGVVELKCESNVANETLRRNCAFLFRVSLGRAWKDWKYSARHDFAESALANVLNHECEQWDFRKAVDRESGTFAVCMEIVPAVDFQVWPP